jgi:hypothetical protein
MKQYSPTYKKNNTAPRNTAQRNPAPRNPVQRPDTQEIKLHVLIDTLLKAKPTTIPIELTPISFTQSEIPTISSEPPSIQSDLWAGQKEKVEAHKKRGEQQYAEAGTLDFISTLASVFSMSKSEFLEMLEKKANSDVITTRTHKKDKQEVLGYIIESGNESLLTSNVLSLLGCLLDAIIFTRKGTILNMHDLNQSQKPVTIIFEKKGPKYFLEELFTDVADEATEVEGGYMNKYFEDTKLPKNVQNYIEQNKYVIAIPEAKLKKFKLSELKELGTYLNIQNQMKKDILFKEIATYFQYKLSHK